MGLKFAFAGFRHGHVLDLYRRAKDTPGIELVAACEEDEAARREAASGGVEVTHTRLEDMLGDVGCDVVAIGDCYGNRGALAIRALEAGKHVIADKPLCTRLSEADEIGRLAGRKGLKVGCMLTMRDSAPMNGVRTLLREGRIGEVHGITFGGQHPLNPGTRPKWYFEPGMHGGTINDIGIHALDGLPWITGLSWTRVEAARCWNAFVPEHPHFGDAAQMMLTMSNGCGVIGDVSYFMPGGSSLPYYWRMTFFGRRGIIEASATMKEIHLSLEGDLTPRALPLPEGSPGGYLRAFLNDIAGASLPGDLDTGEVLRSALTTLTVQQAADEGMRGVKLA